MKVLVIVLGVIIALLGVACAGSGAAVAAAVGTDGWIESDEGQLDTPTHALVSEVADIADQDEDAAEFFDRVDLRLRVTVTTTDKDVFFGVGPAGDVDAYLAGVEHDVVDDIDFDPLDLETTAVPGERAPEPPGDQPFWVEQVSGSGEQELDWDIETGSYRFVLMNADGSAGVDTQAKFALKIPYATGIIIGLLVAGSLGILIGVVMVVLAIRSGPKPHVA
jgi:hypothetical protein